MTTRILVIFTGGTIGSTKHSDAIDVDKTAAYTLLERYKQSPAASPVAFDTMQPMNLLSENAIPADWHTLIAALHEADPSDYDGIIVTHGSDTLAFTAACLSYAFSHSPAPIVLVASNYPLEDERSNGLRNFIGAVDYIADCPLPGIFVVYENRRGQSLVHLGARLHQALPFTDEFDSAYAVPFGRMENRSFVWNDHPLNPPVRAVKKHRMAAFEPGRLGFSTDIMYIKPYTGLNYQYYDFSRVRPRAVLHDLYHSGTACANNTGEQQYSLTRFTQYCEEHGVKLYMAPLKDKSGDLYSSSVHLMRAGAVAIDQMTAEAVLVKLMIGYHTFRTHEEVIDFMERPPLFFERIGYDS